MDGEVPFAVDGEVRLAGKGGGPEWIGRTPAGEKRYDADPSASLLLRLCARFLSILPIEWLLCANPCPASYDQDILNPLEEGALR